MVVQDLTWEASFPAPSAASSWPLADPVDGRVDLVRVSSRQAAERRSAHERRLAGIVETFAELGLDYVVLHTADPDGILRHFSTGRPRLLPEGRL